MSQKKINIAVNCWVLRNKQLDGIGYFTVNTLQRMIKTHPEISFTLLCDTKFNEQYFEGDNVSIKRVFPPFRHPLLYVFFMELILPFILKSLKPDLFFSPDGYLSLMAGCKQVPVIHDLNFEHYPKQLPLKNRLYYLYFFKRFAKKAFRIATVSEYSKQDIVTRYQIDAKKVDVVYCGINSGFHPLTDVEKQEVKNKFSDGKPYFFFVGSLHPRKNMLRLIEAFAIFKANTNSDFKLIIAGSFYWKTDEMQKVLSSNLYKNDIVFTGRLSEDQLRLYFGAAHALTFMPVFEGFGIPIVEAFEMQVPVLTSNISSMPEVGGDAAIYANPFDINEIALGMQQLLENKNDLLKSLIEKGNIRKENFSWDKSAALLWQTLEKSISGIDD
jgi:glycosyltransferase involved in cell wall biosynthesis